MHDLVGVPDIADMFGVRRQRAHKITQKPDFPAPIARVGERSFWERADVEAWAVATGRRLGDGDDEP